MRVKQKQPSGKTIRFALFFVVFIFLIIIGSFVSKGIGVIKSSLFDGQHRFTLLLQSQNNSESILVSFSPKENSGSILRVLGKQAGSAKELSVLLGIPIDAFVSFPSNLQLKEGEADVFLPMAFWEITFNFNKIKTNITLLDAVRLMLIARGIPKHDIIDKTYDFSLSSKGAQDLGALDLLIYSLFSDSAILDEKRSIHIINASGISGLGNRLARIITNMGGNVVAVTTGDSILPVSEIAYSEGKYYTVKKLQKLLQSKILHTSKQAISDIVIIIGKDKAMLFTQ